VNPGSGGFIPIEGVLIARAARALASWAASGFERVSVEEYADRLSICHSCEHLSAPPDLSLYKLIGSQSKTVCGLCGCDVRRKASMASEVCPDESAGRSGRWGSSL
jgi:hypothetical protein